MIPYIRPRPFVHIANNIPLQCLLMALQHSPKNVFLWAGLGQELLRRVPVVESGVGAVLDEKRSAPSLITNEEVKSLADVGLLDINRLQIRSRLSAYFGAEDSFVQAVELDPKYLSGWLALGEGVLLKKDRLVNLNLADRPRSDPAITKVQRPKIVNVNAMYCFSKIVQYEHNRNWQAWLLLAETLFRADRSDAKTVRVVELSLIDFNTGQFSRGKRYNFVSAAKKAFSVAHDVGVSEERVRAKWRASGLEEISDLVKGLETE